MDVADPHYCVSDLRRRAGAPRPSILRGRSVMKFIYTERERENEQERESQKKSEKESAREREEERIIRLSVYVRKRPVRG